MLEWYALQKSAVQDMMTSVDEVAKDAAQLWFLKESCNSIGGAETDNAVL